MRRRFSCAVIGLLAVICVARESRGQDSQLNLVLGAISNTYGTFQAAQFVASLFGIGASSEMAAAINELRTYMESRYNGVLIANVEGDLDLFAAISSNPQGLLVHDLMANFITFSIRDLAQLKYFIQTGSTNEAYALAPAYNLLTVAFVGGVKAYGMLYPGSGLPDSTLDGYFDEAMTVDYDLIGAYVVNYDTFCPNCGNGGYSQLMWTQGSKKMWSKYASNDRQFTAGSWYRCDFRAPANIDSNLFKSCWREVSGIPGLWIPVALSGSALTAALNIATGYRMSFLTDPSVTAVYKGVRGLWGLGHDAICDWNGSGTLACGHVQHPL
jgi:hypothetical protein